MIDLLKRHSILYAEDNLGLRESMASYLQHHFEQVYTAEDGTQALELYRAHTPSVLLLDIDLPRRDGLAVAAEIRERDSRCRIVMMTAYTDTPKLLNAVELQLTKYLVKPVSPTLFNDMLLQLACELGRQDEDCICLHDTLLWHARTLRLYHQGSVVCLTEKERRLLQALVQTRGSCLTFETIMNLLWDDAYEREISIETVKKHVSSLRKKLPGCVIDNVYGKGYLLR